MSYFLKASQAARPLLFLMVDSTDHVTGKTGLSPTVTLSKNGAAFGAPAGAVTELSGGWYKVAANATDTNTLGPLLLHATATGADPSDLQFEVVSFDPEDAAALGLSRLDATVSSRSSHSAADVWSVATRALTDKAGFSLSAAGVQAVWDALTAALTTVGSIGKRLADNLDATVGSRLASASYTAPDNAGIATIQAAVDTEVAAILAAVDTEVAAVKAQTDQLVFTGGRVDASVGAMQANVLTAAALAVDAVDELLDEQIGDSTLTMRQALRVLVAGMAGKLSGAATTTVTIRNTADTADVIVATVDADGNRSAVTVTP